MVTMLLAAGMMIALAVMFALVLGWANVRFHVEQDPRVEAVLEALPGANCGGCGMTNCEQYAGAVVEGKLGPDKCPVGGPSVAREVADILGMEVEESFPYRPVIHCAADCDNKLQLADYRGEPTCFAANVIGGVQGCTYGCTGFGDCVGCGACERACPRHIISMIPFKAQQMLVVACSNKDPGRLVRKVCKVGCLGCKLCQKMLDVFEVRDNISTLNYDRYDQDTDFSKVLAKCPGGAMLFLGKPSDKDLAAVADEELPPVITDQFETTADKADWRG